jgi:hypothetical protein
MSLYRTVLPQLEGGLFATDGGLETTPIYHDGLDLPCFAAVTLMSDEDALRENLPALSVVGGCCGTDHRHVERIGRTLTRSLAMA